jgi:hypothetical protein
VALETLVVISLVLLAWRPRGPSDPPAGQPERLLAPRACVDNGDEDD